MDKTSNSNRKIGNVDFGFSLSKTKSNTVKKTQHSSTEFKKIFTFKNFLSSLKSIRLFIFSVVKVILSAFTKIKWKVSRSIFLGRGVYFKYVSNLSVLLIVSIGVFIYSGTIQDRGDSSSDLISKFGFVAQASEGVLDPSRSSTILSQKADTIKYQVQEKDTLSSIAEKFSTPNNPISVDTIKWSNNITDDTLIVGTNLEFPPVSGTLHIVQSDETLLDIAETYGKTKDKSDIEINGVLQEIADINLLDIRNEGDRKVPVVVEGAKIIIPGGVIAPEIPKLAAVPVNSSGNQEVPQSNPVIPQQILTQPVGGDLLFSWPVANGGGTVTQYASGYHMALDIADSSSPLLVSVGRGVVKSAKWEEPLGAYMVRISLDGGYEAVYAHLVADSFLVSPGEPVEPGQAIGTMGMTGAATGIHVHFEINYNGVKQDPLGYISR